MNLDLEWSVVSAQWSVSAERMMAPPRAEKRVGTVGLWDSEAR